MSTLYTHGKWAVISAAKFDTYDTIQVSSSDSLSSVRLALSTAGTIDFTTKLGLRAAEIYGTAGRDNITSGDGADTIWGFGGKDTLAGGNGDDLLFGDSGNPTVLGDDVLYGGSGNDILVGGAGRDGLYAGAGDDFFLITNPTPGQDSFFGGTGRDILVVSDDFNLGYDKVVFTSLILDSAASVEYFLMDLTKPVTLFGTAENNFFDLSGTFVGNTGSGGLGVSVLFDLSTGSDTLFGGDGKETVVLHDGNDRVELGDGDDSLIVADGNVAGDTLNGGGGSDLIIFQTTNPGDELIFQRLDLSSGAGFEGAQFATDSLYGTAGADVWDMTGLVWSGTGTGYFVYGIELRDGNDLFKGAMSGEHVEGGAGNDTLYGNDGSDGLDAGTGIDALYGGDGDDWLSFDDWQVGDTLDGGRGNNGLTIGRALLPGGTITTLNYEAIRGFSAAHISALTVLGDIRIIGTAASEQIDLSFMTRLRMESAMQLLEGNDRYTGSADGNNVDGGAGNDTLYGGAGLDTLLGGAGDDLMVGGEGGDTYEVNSAGDVIIETGTQGIDVIRTPFATWKITGPFEGVQAEGPGGLRATGNAERNWMAGAEGDDKLIGLDGMDTLVSSGGHDTLIGGEGRDLYILSNLDAVIVEVTGGGRDTVSTSISGYVLGKYLEDLIGGADGQDFFGTGNGAANKLIGGAGNDTLVGMGGDDTIDGSGGDDVMKGGWGDDDYYVWQTGDVIVEAANQGIDKAIVRNAPSYVLPNFVENAELGSRYAENDTFHDHPLGVALTANTMNNFISGSEAADTIDARTGADSVYAGDGDDQIYFGDWTPGLDLLYGGNGTDTLHFGDPSGQGAPVTLVLHDLAFLEKSSIERLVIEDNVVLTGTEGNDGFYFPSVSGEVLASTIDLLGGNDGFSGGAGDDRVDGGDGNDVLGGNDGNDLLIGGDGYNTIFGGQGNDTLDASAADWDQLYGGNGDDVYIVGPGTVQILESYSGVGDTSFDTVVTSRSIFSLSDGLEAVVAVGSGGLYSWGTSFDNLMQGAEGNDYFRSLEGTDTLIGGEGQDSLFSGEGNDICEGGLGADLFVFDTAPGSANVDHIRDFTHLEDKIVLYAPIFTALLTGATLASSAFRNISDTVHAGADSRILYEATSGRIFYDSDGSGATQRILIAVLDTHPTLSAADFVVTDSTFD